MKDHMPEKQRQALDCLAWRLMNSAISSRQEPESYAPIRLLDGAVGIFEVLGEENAEYRVLVQQISKARVFAVDDTDRMVHLLDQLILERIRSRRERQVCEPCEEKN